MFSKFNLTLDKKDLVSYYEYYKYGKRLYEQLKSNSKMALNQFITIDGVIDGKKMQQNWFPDNVKFDIFLSHSHKDEELAIALAGYLNREFNLTVFIDSCLWGYSNDLLRVIDNKYCRFDENSDSYNYDKRNYSTSHIHMMLSVALNNMIDKCESIFFLNTPSSINLKENISDKVTMSPWIYSELSSVNTMRITKYEEYRKNISNLLEHAENAYGLEIAYDVTELINSLIEINCKDFEQLQSKYDRKSHALDLLYLQKNIIKKR